ncbi:NUDIX hydrolase [Reinekea blandensis]|uniref:Nudix hydrolase domain-containing protein n=1 Tax=Reinekea blandensis MED297 TaxID=314283 RepID=A4BE94_9GAMM|nr:NUDIX domain-containing protein [Reinekea blandensis]EAR09572.1 hypothetical protein MED297_12612 [Reinekea blandensis MED297]
MIPLCPDAASCVVLRSLDKGQTQILLLKRCEADGGFWSHVGGGVHAGETAVQAVLRELYEETGLRPERLYNAEYLEQFYQVEQNRILVMPVFVVFVAGDANVVLNDEHTDFTWCAFSQALERVPFHGQRQLYEHVWRLFVERSAPSWLRIPCGS